MHHWPSSLQHPLGPVPFYDSALTCKEIKAVCICLHHGRVAFTCTSQHSVFVPAQEHSVSIHKCVLACRQKEAAAASRKDSKLKAVVISEAWDKKSSKYNSPSLPFPFDCKTTYEQSMRTPMGRQFNTTAVHRLVLLQSEAYPGVFTSVSKLGTHPC